MGRGSSAVGVPLRNFGKFIYPTLPASFGGDTKRSQPLLADVYARRSKISQTGGKWTPPLLEKDNSQRNPVYNI